MTDYSFRGNAGSNSSAIKLRIYFWNPSLLLDAALGAGWLLASDSLPCWRKSRCKTLVRHRFRGLLPFCQCRRASRQKGRRDEIGRPSRFFTVAHHAAQPPRASHPPLNSLLRSPVNPRERRHFVTFPIPLRASLITPLSTPPLSTPPLTTPPLSNSSTPPMGLTHLNAL